MTDNKGEVGPPLITKDTTNKTDDAPASSTTQTNATKSAAKTPAKKGVLTSSENAREAAKKLKELKDERRSQLDARHQFMFEKIADCIGVDISVVEDWIIVDKKFDTMEHFFNENGCRAFYFFYQEQKDTKATNASAMTRQKRVIVGSGNDQPALDGTAFIFTRTTSKRITSNNVSSELNFSFFEAGQGKILNALEDYISQNLFPILKNLDDWGSLSKANGGGSKIEEFLDCIQKFLDALHNAKGNMNVQVELSSPPDDLLHRVTSPSDLQAAVHSSDTLEKLEKTLLNWSKEIEQLLNESEQIRREADDVGPSAELAYWKTRMTRFNNLLEQMNKKEVKKVVAMLHSAKSRLIKHWRELDGRITDAANEARDNVKYLYTLDKFFGPLAKCNPETMLEHIPALINAIRMIYSISQYYNTSERMTSLFVKITNQMITVCRAYIRDGVVKIWEHPRDTLLTRTNHCLQLNREYQACFKKTQEKLRENPQERQFEFSENYIFGKFDTFCKRLYKISDILNVVQSFSGLNSLKMDGIDQILVRYKTISETIKKKNYDVLDHRKLDFDQDYNDFKSNMGLLENALYNYIDNIFKQPMSTEAQLMALNKFENIKGIQFDFNEKYAKILDNYSKEMENVRRLYQRQKDDPPIARNMPPLSGKIAWARHLFDKIDKPMVVFKTEKRAILQLPESRKIIKNYNKMAEVLLAFEMLYHQNWFSCVKDYKIGLKSSLLTRDKTTERLVVNLDPVVIELILESHYMQTMGLEIPPEAFRVLFTENNIKDIYRTLDELLAGFYRTCDNIPMSIKPLLQPFIHDIEGQMEPGLVQLTWVSSSVDNYIDNVGESLRDFNITIKRLTDMIECRVETVLDEMSLTSLVNLPEEEPVTGEQFLELTQEICGDAANYLAKQSNLAESAVSEVVDTIKSKLSENRQKNLSVEEGWECLDESHKTKKQRCQECLPCQFFTFWSHYTQRNTEAMIRCTKLSLDNIRKRAHQSSTLKYLGADDRKPALFKSDVVLELPKIATKPSLDDLQHIINKGGQIILRMASDIPQWEHMKLTQKQAQRKLQEESAKAEGKDLDSMTEEDIEELKIPGGSAIRSLNKIITEHKDVAKIVAQLGTVLSVSKGEDNQIFSEFEKYKELWSFDINEKVTEFMSTKPSWSEIGALLKSNVDMETDIAARPTSYKVGAVLYVTQKLKEALVQECKTWRLAYGQALNQQCGKEMDDVLEFFDGLMKRLLRPVQDLDDVRSHMAALTEVRDNEIRMDMMIAPIEETYALLSKYDIVFNDGNAEKVDALNYGKSKLKEQVQTVQDHLLQIQPTFKEDLLSGVKLFQQDLTSFVDNYDNKGPQEPGIAPREASDRLTIFQGQFDSLWRKFETYSGGEDLFGLTVTDYPDLQRIKKDLTLMQKLYQLYNQVLETVNGYYDIAWTDIDIEAINQQLTEFQNRCRKLPKALKEWQAFEDLRKTIDDFSESCPLLEMMANKAMVNRHWERLENLTKHKFDVDSDNFLLRNLMEAPLLENKDDIEDICVSAVKEKDIEAKLKQVINDWGAQNFNFSTFKNRGELLLKGDTTAETVSLMEDSLMVLGSLLSNRYNAPFKPKIQEWVSKLSGSTEIIENWLLVQNLWVYLEAVFVGGDIAKQLPAEAKRFGNIDKSWQRVMQKAHENTNVVQCCMGDETLAQLLPHLLEQLELCQKSLTGYLEKKRLVFPRFFFVSDPSLLEILGQASDSHTIQSHLLSIFDNTKSVTFDDKMYDKILAVNSQEGESISLDQPVVAQGNVEVWLGDLLKVSKQSVHSVIRSAYLTLQDPNFKLMEFENSYPAQVGLLGLQMLWTRDAEEALVQAKLDRKVMTQTNEHFLHILNELIQITTTELSKIDRTKFETLITIHVHQKDIFDDLVKQHIKTPTDFEWLKQSRFYFKEDTDQCLVSITDVDFNYMDEFLGCTDRLVITPLTDRCYITLSQALSMALGGAPAGPAGTGKTETTKDMGRCLGKYVVVFNCSDQMDYRGLGRIYKGLAQSGSWGCFDEFNRIELPVLSVAAQQIAIVLASKKERKTQFLFTDGDVVDLDPEFGIFLTMNPGYAGRQELPENLKINFRTVAMMVPDRGIIMRVKLASCGFQQNVMLSKKFFTLYKLCEEQLSKQVHYDFGLRNILSVLRTLGAFKRANPEDSETMTVMRILRDMNLSKLVDEDEPLFMSLIDDLFPGLQLEKKGYPEIEAAIQHQVEDLGLIYHAPWVLKVIQLFETQRVRHGIMTLGPSGAGKSKCIATLMRALTETGSPHKEMRMNPKAITAPQMFGRLDVATNDWTDGIFSTLWRRTHKTKKGDNVWLILDGPVDAIWIENLNSVLDDTKTLTLANGDRITMAPNCKIIFEVHNIDNASPATVSRNGMIFMSSSILDWQPILKGWLLQRPENQREIILETFQSCFGDIQTLVTQTLNLKMPFLECNFIRQATDLLVGLIPSGDDAKELSKLHLQRLIVFSIMWSLGALLELEDRKKLEENMKTFNIPLPPAGGDDTIFEFVVNEQGDWQHWNERVVDYIYPTDITPDYTSILVPNVDNTRTDFLVHTIAKQSKPVLLIGEQGTAKTVMIKGYLSKFDPEVHMFKALNFSSATTPNMFQRTVESYVDKRMGTTYGPPAGKKMTIFIDDINMPIINEWGDQITNEITRQMIEMNGYYNLDKPGDFTSIIDIQFLAAMIHPGGGRNDIPQRIKRHFCVFNCTLPSNASIDKIFRTVGLGHYCSERGFSEEISDLIGKLVPATRRLWQRTKIRMLPTPAKFHYVFNLRDLSRIWQGMLNTIAEVANNPEVLLSLWKHECTRTIADRFTEMNDKDWFEKTLKATIDEECGSNFTSMMSDEPYFVDFLREAPEPTGDEPDDADLEAPKIYEPIQSFQQLNDKLQFYMQQYNELIRGGKLDLVFFKDAMTHLVKISRIIRTTKGHALLVGVGGSGKQSLTRLASFIAGYGTFQIVLTRSYNVSNLMEDLKQLYRTAGGQGKGVTFIFTDNEIKDEGFLEFLNNMLSSGEIANLFARDEMDEILGELVPVMKKEFPKRPPTNENLQEYYFSRVLKYLHVVLCFSPVGEKFRNRSLKFPGLISGCTMDWFQRWPKEALVSVSQYFLSSFDIVCTPEVKESVVNTMGMFQDLVAETCSDYFSRFRRQTHVTPKSYLSFISGYKDIYQKKHEELKGLAGRMNTGLKKLLEATESVNELSKELVEKEKELAVANAKAEEVLKSVTEKATSAQKVKAQVQVVKDRAQALVDAIGSEKAVAEGKLEAAKPALMEAERALQTIKPADISTVKKLAKPPHLIMRIMDCVLLLFQKKVDPVTMDPERPCVKPSWPDAQKLMSGNLLSDLLSFPKDSINDETVEFLQPYFDMEDYNLEMATKVSANVAGLCSWTTAMAMFFGINKEVLPLKANLAVQQNRLDKAMTELNVAQGTLDAKQKELDIVQAEYDKAMAEKQALMDDADACRRKMNNATTLIEGLSGERVRWTEASKGFEAQTRKLVGDVLLATAFLSYTGPFNQDFRNLMMRSWKKELIQNKIPFSDDLNVISMLVDNATIAEWNLQGLPNDELSIQNGLIVTRASRYPMLIDPQGQGKAWIKSKEKDNELQLTSLNHKYFRTHLEDCLSLGRPLLIEDVGEELDPALDNVLERNFIKSGTRFKVKVGDKECDLMDGFMLYITTKFPNPKYTPEIYAKTSIIDFTVTMKGLEDQLLGVVILTEKAELEAERTKLMEEVTANKRKTQELEDNLLYRLTSTEGSLVEDESLIQVLQVTKVTAEEVREKLAIAADTEIKINTAREEYRPIASRGSLLYFLIVEMSMVNVMYQTSLRQFLGLFDISMAKSVKSPVTSKRISNIIEYLTYEVYRYTARGFYESDKFTFTILLTLKLQIQAGHVRHDEFSLFIKGGAALDLNAVEPKPKKWIQDMIWLNLVELSKLPQFNLLPDQIGKNDRGWKNWCDADVPEDCPIPDGYDKLSTFHKLLLIRCITPDRTIPTAKRYVAETMGVQFAEGIITNLEGMSEEADSKTPMTCFLSMGSDPTDNIERLAKKMGIQPGAISMGQGQEVHARKLLQVSMTEGRWILLQNCHLGLNFMDELLETVTTGDSHENFRCWITTEPHKTFPINLLQSSIKFTYDPPQGIRAGLRRTYGLITQDQLDVSNMPQWKPMLYVVAFLHTVVQERRKFGPIGWNIPYEFNQSDFAATTQFCQNHLDDMDIKRGVSWNTVRYMVGEVQYGGRVTDDYDKRLLNTYAKVWCTENIFAESFQFNKGYKIPKFKQIDEYRNYIDTLPLVDYPDVFGLHANADVTYQTNNANSMLETILNIQPKDSGGGGTGETRESIVYKQCDDMLAKLPQDYNPFEVKDRLRKMDHLKPLHIFLKQEIDRMQRVIASVRSTLSDLKLAIDGTIIMSEVLQDALDNMFDARIPVVWRKISWDSATLGFWFTDLLDRNVQFHSWLFEGRPNVYWMTGFFNPQGFLTAMRQEITRAHKGWALDAVVLNNDVTKLMREEVHQPPSEGVYVYGLNLDGAGWDRKNGRLMEPPPKVLYTPLPVVHVFAINTDRPKSSSIYECPVYKKPRRTDLNYIFPLLLRTSKDADHWTLRGVALLCDVK